MIYRSAHANMERNFALAGLTSAHAEKDMSKTFKVVLEQLIELLPNEYKSARTSHYSIPNILANGAAIIEEEGGRRMGVPVAAATEGDEVEGDDEMSDLEDAGEREPGGGLEDDLETELTADDLSVECDI